MTEKSIDADTMVGFLDNFSLGIASFCHRILRNLTSRRFFGGCSRGNGFTQKIALLRTLSFTLPIGHWLLWETD